MMPPTTSAFFSKRSPKHAAYFHADGGKNEGGQGNDTGCIEDVHAARHGQGNAYGQSVDAGGNGHQPAWF